MGEMTLQEAIKRHQLHAESAAFFGDMVNKEHAVAEAILDIIESSEEVDEKALAVAKKHLNSAIHLRKRLEEERIQADALMLKIERLSRLGEDWAQQNEEDMREDDE